MIPVLYSLVLHRHSFRPEDEGKGNGASPEEIGVFTIYLLIASLSVLFLGGIIAYFWMNYSLANGYKSTWSFQKINNLFWFLYLPSFLLLLSSLTLKKAQTYIKKDQILLSARFLLFTCILGLSFLLWQVFSWFEIKDYFSQKNIYIFIYYLLTFLHAFHLSIGQVFLVFIYLSTQKGYYTKKSHSPIRFISIYWHFLTVVWFIILATLLI